MSDKALPSKSTGPIATPEQQAIFALVRGFYLVVANAGSGKTWSCAELFVIFYLKEEAKLFPQRGHVSGRDQEKLLGLFLIVTFTRKAAQELDARIIEKLSSLGVPTTGTNDKPIRICRTIDSAIGQWLRNKHVFQGWTLIRPELPTTFRAYGRTLQQSVQNELTGPANIELGRAFFREWGGLLTGGAQLAFVDTVWNAQQKLPTLSGCSLQAIETAIRSYLPSVAVKADLRTIPIIKVLNDVFTTENNRIQSLEKSLGKRLPSSSLDEINAWRSRSAFLEGFLTAFDFARSRGWDPLIDLRAIDRQDVLESLAGTGAITSISDFISLSKGYQEAKLRYGFYDYGDLLAIFVSVLNDEKWGGTLLERKREYPVMGVRRKYVIMDENQDNNGPQFAIQRKLTAAADTPYLSLGVGDPFQSLYEFRGAHPVQFIRGIERLRTAKPENLLTLSCCFRSGRGIVDLGNEIIATQSRFGEFATPSRAVKQIDCCIEVPKPFADQRTEAAFIVDRASRLVSRGESVMILMRANIAAHPIRDAVTAADLTGIQLMTVHGSKGLEADHVFIVALNAGAFPDVRCSPEQEVNLFYVACTRARRSLTLTCHKLSIAIDKDGSIREEHPSPSPFIGRIPSLRAKALASGWEKSLFAEADSSHRQAMAIQIEARAMLVKNYKDSLKHILPSPGNASIEVEPEVTYKGARESSFQIALTDDKPAFDENALPDGLTKSAVFAACKKVFVGGGRPTHLKSSERLAAVQLGWIAFRGESQAFSPAFIGECRG